MIIDTDTESPRAKTQSAGGRQPPHKPPVAAASAAPRRGESATVLMRSFSPMPARLSPVKRGEVRVTRPSSLKGTGETGFAFHLTESASSLDIQPNHRLYARTGQPSPGDLTLAIDHAGKAQIGHLAEPADEVLRLTQQGVIHAIPAATLAELAVVVEIDRR